MIEMSFELIRIGLNIIEQAIFMIFICGIGKSYWLSQLQGYIGESIFPTLAQHSLTIPLDLIMSRNRIQDLMTG